MRSSIIVVLLQIPLLTGLSISSTANSQISPPDNAVSVNIESILHPTSRVSVSSSGVQANNHSSYPDISADGRFIVFDSTASNLVANDTNNASDVFLYDRIYSTTTRVSIASDGSQGNSSSGHPSISSDGRFVAFQSSADNFYATDTNNDIDVFVRDTYLNTTEIISIDATGTHGQSSEATISGDGRYVAFVSTSNKLVSGDTNGFLDVFLRDRQLGTTIRVSLATDGTQGNAISFGPSISDSGARIAFASMANTLVSGDPNPLGTYNAYVYYLQTGITECISLNSSGEMVAGLSSNPPHISGDGNYVAFNSGAVKLVPSDTNTGADPYVRDLVHGITELVALSTSGTQEDVTSAYSTISSDGRFVEFRTTATNLVPGDTNGLSDVFIRDRQMVTTERVSIATDGTQGNGDSRNAVISADGRFVVFESLATNLVPGDTNGAHDIFLRERGDTPTLQPMLQTGYSDLYGDPAYDDGTTIGKWGCMLTSYSIALDYYGQYLSPAQRVDPQKLNTWLRAKPGGYSKKFVNHCAVLDYAASLGINLKVSGKSLGQNNALLDSMLSSGALAIAGVNNDGHYVLVTRKNVSESTYDIFDPLIGKTTLSVYGNTYSSLRFLSIEALHTWKLCGSGHSPIELILSDAQGRRLGYDPRTDTVYSEIPNSVYYIEALAPDGGDGTAPDAISAKWIEIESPLSGTYGLEVLGTGIGAYDLFFSTLNASFHLARVHFSGSATTTSNDSFTLDYYPFSVFLPHIERW